MGGSGIVWGGGRNLREADEKHTFQPEAHASATFPCRANDICRRAVLARGSRLWGLGSRTDNKLVGATTRADCPRILKLGRLDSTTSAGSGRNKTKQPSSGWGAGKRTKILHVRSGWRAGRLVQTALGGRHSASRVGGVINWKKPREDGAKRSA